MPKVHSLSRKFLRESGLQRLPWNIEVSTSLSREQSNGCSEKEVIESLTLADPDLESDSGSGRSCNEMDTACARDDVEEQMKSPETNSLHLSQNNGIADDAIESSVESGDRACSEDVITPRRFSVHYNSADDKPSTRCCVNEQTHEESAQMTQCVEESIALEHDDNSDEEVDVSCSSEEQILSVTIPLIQSDFKKYEGGSPTFGQTRDQLLDESNEDCTLDQVEKTLFSLVDSSLDQSTDDNTEICDGNEQSTTQDEADWAKVRRAVSGEIYKIPVQHEEVQSKSYSAPVSDCRRKSIIHQQQRLRLLLIRHSVKCPHSSGACPVSPHCGEIKHHLQHIVSCKDEKCDVRHCVSSRYILAHYHHCKDSTCPVCGPVQQMISRGSQTMRGQVHAFKRGHQEAFVQNLVEGESDECVPSPNKRQKPIPNEDDFQQLCGRAAGVCDENAGDQPKNNIEDTDMKSRPADNGIALEPDDSTVAQEEDTSTSHPTNTPKGRKRVVVPFTERIAQLKAYKEKHGHLTIKPSEDKSLSIFCMNIRQARRNPEGSTMKLTEERIGVLDALGFDWTTTLNRSLEELQSWRHIKQNMDIWK